MSCRLGALAAFLIPPDSHCRFVFRWREPERAVARQGNGGPDLRLRILLRSPSEPVHRLRAPAARRPNQLSCIATTIHRLTTSAAPPKPPTPCRQPLLIRCSRTELTRITPTCALHGYTDSLRADAADLLKTLGRFPRHRRVVGFLFSDPSRQRVPPAAVRAPARRDRLVCLRLGSSARRLEWDYVLGQRTFFCPPTMEGLHFNSWTPSCHFPVTVLGLSRTASEHATSGGLS